MKLGDIALQVKKSKHAEDIADVITFVEADWGLRMKLFPVQRIILKAHYGIPLDDNPYGLDLEQPVPLDHPLYNEITAHAGSEAGYYRWRVLVSDWRRINYKAMSEADYLRMLYDEGRSNIKEVVEGQQRTEMVLALGRRSGKTQLAACIAAYETYKLLMKGNPQFYYGLPDGDDIMITSVATDKDQAKLLFNKVSAYFRKCPFFSPYTANHTMSYARFQTSADIERSGRYRDDPKGAEASLEVTFKSCVAKGLRGQGNMVIILDEIAHFTDGSGQSSAESVYKAIAPSKAAFSPKDPDDPTTPIGQGEGRIISISSPLGKQGKFYELFQLGMAGTENFICIQAPTWEANPTIPRSEFEKDWAKDPIGFDTEFGAEFTDRTRGWIEVAEDLYACIDDDLRPAFRAPARKPHFMGIDFALKDDATAVAIGHVNEHQKVVLDLIDQIKANEGEFEGQDRLDFDDVADWILDLSRRFYIAEGLFDQWAGILFEQALHKRGLRQIRSESFSRPEQSQVFKNFKDMMWDKRLVLYNWPVPERQPYCPYIVELTELQATVHSKNIITVQAPQVKGKHDDRPDALVRMVWLASQHIGKPKYISKGDRARPMRDAAIGTRANMQRYLKTRRSGSHPDRMMPRQARAGSGRR